MEEKFQRLQELCPGFDFWELYYSMTYYRDNVKYSMFHPTADYTIVKKGLYLVSNLNGAISDLSVRPYNPYPILEINKRFGIDSLDYFLNKWEKVHECIALVSHIPTLSYPIRYADQTIYDKSNQVIYNDDNALDMFIGLCYREQKYMRSMIYWNGEFYSISK